MTRLVLSLLLAGLFLPGLVFYPGSRSVEGPMQEDAIHEEEFTARQLEFFESKVRPLLIEHCYDCHGPDADPPEGGLSLASRKAIMAGGDSGPGIDLNDLAESNILSAVQYGDLFQMPPDSRLSAEDLAIFEKWVMDKAPWPADSDVDVAREEEFDIQKRKAEHWCWQPITRPEVPTVKNANWPLDPIDNFILAKLEQAALSPATAADRRTWLRRVTFDITGLPPTADEIEDFVNDDSKDAFEKVVDRLLASPRFGERWARHWMDLIRYAETCGHEFDYPIPYAHQYRDYLIRAFNADVPYDQFVMEHIAGDLVGYPRLHPETRINESILGTGFWFLGEATHGPVDVKGDEAGRIDNQIDVFGKTFLGLTIACARCHDHKFDAISAEDYYAMSGFLQSSRRQNVMLDPDRKILKAFNKSMKESDKAAVAIEGFISSLDDSGDNVIAYEKYMRAAVLFLQQDDSWRVPERLVVEGESLKLEKTAGNARHQGIKGWSKGGQIWWTDAKVGDELELELNTPLAGTYEILVRFTKARDYGIVDVLLNGETVAESIDLFADKVIRSDEMSLGSFDLPKGPQEVRLRITGKNEKAIEKYMVGVDYLVLIAEREPVNETDVAARKEVLCEEYQIEQDRLDRWIAAIQDPATDDIEHPFFLLRKSAESDIDLNSDRADEFYRGLYGQLHDLETQYNTWEKEQSIALPATSQTPLVDWDRQGFGFMRRYADGQFNPVDVDPIRTWIFEAPHSGLLGKKFQGVLRSPTFEITHPNIYYHVAARDAQIRLIIDGFRLDVNNALLFNGMSMQVDTDGKWKWILQGGDLKNYIGHRAFIEIIDQSDGFIGVDRIRVSKDAKPPEQRPSPVSINPFHHRLDDSQWHNARYNEGQSPLEVVTQSMSGAIQGIQMYSVKDTYLKNKPLFNFMVKYRLIPNVEYAAMNKILAEARSNIEKINEQVSAPIPAIGMVDGSPENEYVFIRGNHKNTGHVVSRAPITALNNKWKDDLPSSGRFELAENVVDLENPLTRRVIVNRIWHHLTGQGIVPSVDNYGVLGDKPTHPELLDHLASEFSDDGWSIKRMIKRIVLSQTYRMSSTSEIDASETDPKNDLLHEFRVRRLQGEAIRDSILAVSGELDETMYGPSVPIHLTAFMQGRGRPGKSGPLDGNGRRSIYIEVRRNFLSPMMLAFDTPIPFNSIGRRNNSNVPAQALILMNDPFVIDQAEKWARRLIEDESNANIRLSTAFVAAMGREPTDVEVADLKEFLKTQGETYGEESTELQLWKDLCHVLFNLKEFIYVE